MSKEQKLCTCGAANNGGKHYENGSLICGYLESNSEMEEKVMPPEYQEGQPQEGYEIV